MITHLTRPKELEDTESEMSKFDSLRTRILYSRASSDEEVGSSSEGIGWAGLYMRWEGVGGYILHEDTQGFVTHQHFTDDESLQKAWFELCDVLEFSGDPDQEDFVILINPKTDQYHSLVTGETLMFDSLNEIVAELLSRGQNQDKTPPIWLLNERGNFIPLSVADYIEE